MTTPTALSEIVDRMLGETGDVQLASLTREELRAVGDDPLLADAADTLWWEALSEREQELVLETAQRSLVARNLLRPDDGGQIVATDEVVAALSARRAPDWVIVLGDPEAPRDSDGAPLQIALLALPSEAGHPCAVLVSARVEGVYLHRLVRPPTSYVVAADWLLRPAEDPTATVGRTVEVLAPTNGRLETARMLVVGRGEAWRCSIVSEDGPSDPTPTDVETLAAALAESTGVSP